MYTEQTRDKIRGCLVGGAAGDALGYAVEFLDENTIFRRYGENGIQRYEKDVSSGKALISDDTQMTMFTANGLLLYDTARALGAAEGPAARYVAAAYQDWLDTQYGSFAKENSENRVSWLCDVPELYSPRAPGNTCISALQAQRNGAPLPDPERPINNSKGCGGVMRAAPVGLLRRPDANLADVTREGANAAAVTHGHPLGWLPAAALACIVRMCAYPERPMSLRETVTKATAAVAAVFADEPQIGAFTDIMERAVRLSENTESDLDNIHRLGEGWVGEEALAIAVYSALRHQSDFSACICAAVNHKGDSDSTGAVAGNILGAWLGLEAIDPVWKQDLELYDELIELADDLASGCRLNENGMPDPEWQRKYARTLR
ncbi:MAG: ADP-ribosylglycohydrolase family protein [Clostridia bacterium]|nr:ADP-ribosylglycohydrolase family protein [Clostridia bacterium]